MNYEISRDLMSEGYIVRCDTDGNLQYGTLLNVLERFTQPQAWGKIASRLLAYGKYEAPNGTIHDLIGWKWQDPKAHQTAWDEFYTKGEAGRSVKWYTDYGAYNINQVKRNSILI